MAFALASQSAYAQVPQPDPAPIPAPAPAPPPPSEPVVEQPAPNKKKASRPARKAEKKKPKPPLALRMARLHPPLVENVPYFRARPARAPVVSIVDQSRPTASSPSDSFPMGLVLLVALIGAMAAAVVVFTALPERLLGNLPLLTAHHRGEVAFGGFVVLLGMSIGIAIPLLLR